MDLGLFDEVSAAQRQMLEEELRSCNLHSRSMQVRSVYRVRAERNLGQTGQSCKLRLWHGTKTLDAANSIASGGFDLDRANIGAFGKGIYFSPHSCKALNYTPHSGQVRPLFLCEVAVGLPENRMVCPPVYSDITQNLCYRKLLCEQGFRCVQYIAEAPVSPSKRAFVHDEFTVFKVTQARPLYVFLVEPGDGTPACDSGPKKAQMLKRARDEITALKGRHSDRHSDTLLGLRSTVGAECSF